ncbi:7260_t:CDS:1, partial [Racocetra persica]
VQRNSSYTIIEKVIWKNIRISSDHRQLSLVMTINSTVFDNDNIAEDESNDDEQN